MKRGVYLSKDILELYYGITPQQSINDGYAIRFVVDNSLYTLVPVTHVEEDTLIELYEMSDHMAKNGDKKVSTFVEGKNKKYLVTHDDQDYVLLHNHYLQPIQNNNTGRKLAVFHERGRLIRSDFKELNRVGQWKSYWIKRLEQMENVWAGMISEQPRDEFDHLFIKSFPYYLGLCENAIQYLTDTELDEQVTHLDMGSICHQRFHDHLWQSQLEIHNPFDWVFDHPARDISEWIRSSYFQNSRTIQPEIVRFLNDYQSITPISAFTLRLTYSRLLFPLHYFQCVEEYFLTSSESAKKHLEEKLAKYIRDAKQYELFLGNFFKITGMQQSDLPVIDWLA